MAKIIVVGSSNTDMVVKTQRFPEPGETILGGNFFMFPGGKGANQAVAAARAGGEVTFICAVGDDVFGQNALEGYREEGIHVDFAKVIKDAASGVALITVNGEGENEIVVASGTNAKLSPIYVSEVMEEMDNDGMFLTQLETPVETIEYLARYSKLTDQPLIINPAPAQELSDAILDGLFLITPNETEAKILTGISVEDDPSMEAAAQALLDSGVQNVIITLGSRGAFFMNCEEKFLVPSHQVKAIDTTAAGDVFNGVLTVCLSQEMGWRESIAYANKAAALSVTKMGAQGSAPYKEEINKFN
ncbi:ribokinase [Maribacter halichondriae]|uniref:ribokinase n=1 Tax=Maribacter halichondriae TaxID=2980554 RepID=UPI002358D37F|nr:ribokinase [Maribacter sp. Hal144]